jgi:hypothetical protein
MNLISVKNRNKTEFSDNETGMDDRPGPGDLD